MSRNSPSSDLDHDSSPTSPTGTADNRFGSLRDRLRFKRIPKYIPNFDGTITPKSSKTMWSADRQHKSGRSQYQRSLMRKLLLLPYRSWLYLSILFVVFVFALATTVMQSSIKYVLVPGGSEGARRLWSVREDLKLGSSLQFVPRRRFDLNGGGLDWLRTQPRIGVRPPRLGLILGNMEMNPSSLMLSTVMKSLQQLGYLLEIYAIDDGIARSMWEHIGGQVTILGPERDHHVDWSAFEGIIVHSLEAKKFVSSLMQEPFSSVPLIWIIEEDTLANRLQIYEDTGLKHLISHWKNIFCRPAAIVFPDFSFPMLYSLLDSGNFLVIPGSPVDVWAAETYSKTHSKPQLRKENGFDEEDMLVLVVGSSFFYNELSWNYAMAMHDIESLLVMYAKAKDVGETFKFIFLCGNSSEEYNDALQDVARRLGLKQGSLVHFGLDGDVNRLILMADIVLYASSQSEQSFPSLLIRAMSFGLPTVAPDYSVIKKYVVDGVHGLIFPKQDRNGLTKAFSLLISKGRLSKFAHSIASYGRLLARNMLAADCISAYAKLLEDVVNFPSDVQLPSDTSQIKQTFWGWDNFQKEIEQAYKHPKGTYQPHSHVIYEVEEDGNHIFPLKNVAMDDSEALEGDIPSRLDWDILGEIERSEEVERLEMEEIDERLEKHIGEWNEIYRTARKSEKLRFETNERDEGELERTGQPLCIYEIYSGSGAWPFLHHGSLYRGLSLSSRARRLTSDDLDAVSRLPLLNDTYYRDVLCEIGGMFSIANDIDNVHKRPWIGFQSWRAAGKKASLSTRAEEVLEKAIQENTKGDVIFYWARLDIDGEVTGTNNALTFWSMCDILNGGNCRTAFKDAFRQMYGLPSNIEALPPMPEDGGHWSALHSWVMPTPSFLEFVMFSRMFVDSLHGLSKNSSNSTSHCPFGSSLPERQHCYCRVLELLVNVWAYHSARRMVYIDPRLGISQEQHIVEHRRGFMWVKYFNATLLKSMDEDLAEAADDHDHPYETWLWPLTGEVYWQGIYERNREERYRLKMDKRRKTKEKLLERMKNGYKQKSLGG